MGGKKKLFVDDVFSTYLYTGNGATQTIDNGIDLAGKGGMVWTKERGLSAGHVLIDTNRGVSSLLSSSTTNAAEFIAGYDVSAFNSTGYDVTSGHGSVNTAARTYVGWTFRKAPKFFDVQTKVHTTGTPSTVDLSPLGTVGMVIVKCTGSTSNWPTWHRSQTAGKLTQFNWTYAEATEATISISGTTLTIASTTASGTYVVYAWAHDSGADGLVQCGSYVGNGSATGPVIALGWEPQYVILKRATVSDGNWVVTDSMRGIPTGSNDATLNANTNDAEGSFDTINLSPTGFTVTAITDGVNNAGSVYIYLAIRRPNKPPTSGSQVYNAIARTGTGAAATVTGVGFAPDLCAVHGRNIASQPIFNDRLRGAEKDLFPNQTTAETTQTSITSFASMDGVTFGTDSGVNLATYNYINHFFRRAPGFFDIVAYTGTGVARTVAHNLGVAPELMIVKSRSNGISWYVTGDAFAVTEDIILDSTGAKLTNASLRWDSTRPTASVFSIGTGTQTNTSAATYVAYLFASLPGISKVGSYTGNGTSQTINCGFAAGARFVLIKRTDSTGDWFVWDTTRGIVAANDPHLSLNTTAAEVTTDDSVDPDATGFIVNQVVATNINVTSATYIFLAVS